MYTRLHLSFKNHVALITLDHNATLNAIDLTMADEILAALKETEESKDAHIVVITGAGRAFSGGGNIQYMKDHCQKPDFVEKSMGPLAKRVSEIVLYMKKMKKIVIAAVSGAAAGGGANIALAADFIFAAENAKFIQAFVGIGLCPDTGGTYFLPRMVGAMQAMDMFITGRPVSAEEAYRLGLIKSVVAKADLLPQTIAFAEKLAKGPTLVYQNTKKLVFESLYHDFEKFMSTELKYVSQCAESDDFKEGITAFLEKRPPKFTGK